MTGPLSRALRQRLGEIFTFISDNVTMTRPLSRALCETIEKVIL